MIRTLILFSSIFLLTISSLSQSANFSILMLDNENDEPLIGASIYIDEIKKGTATNIDGLGYFSNIKQGKYLFKLSYIGYQSLDTILTIDSITTSFTVKLNETENNLSEVTIKATRSTRTIENIPTRVELVGGEELEEKAIMNAANISLVLRESTGIQIQQTSLSSGNSSIRIQGLDGRYTQLLKDGFPLYGGFSGGLSIMQIPPLDLAQFEIIKGSSSTLYGGGAIAGLVNMVSKQPEEEPMLDILLAQTHTGGSTGNVFFGKRKNKFGYTLYGAGHYNAPYNPDEDNFTNIPLTTSLSLNPKLFYYPNENSTLWFGVNTTTDKREGGDIDLIKSGADSIHTYFENNNSNRLSTQLSYQNKISDNQNLEFKNSFGFFNRSINLPNYTFKGSELNSFTEFNYSKETKISDWVFGANLYTNSFRENTDTLPRDISQVTFGGFINNTTDVTDKLILESGLRLDYSTDWVVFPLPRVSVLWKANSKFSTRLGGGLGYKLPDLFTEEAATLNFENILPIDKDNIKAENSYGINLDFNYRTALTDEIFFSINQLFYITQISNSLLLDTTINGVYTFINASNDIQSIGLETNIKFSYKDFRWFINYAFINTKLKYLAGNPQKPLTPKHNAGTVLMFENEDWRIGYEAYYTGKQLLSNGIETTDFITMGLLIQKHFKWGSPYVNFENFTDRRQNRFSPEVTGTVQNPIFQELYAPTDGFVFTIGIHIKPFGREEEH